MLNSIKEGRRSDTSVLVTIEELIARAMGPPEANIVDFKVLEKILQILAKQQRILQQKVEIKVIDLKSAVRKKHHKIDKKPYKEEEKMSSTSRYSSGIDFVRRSRFDLLQSSVEELNSAIAPKLLQQPEDMNLLNERIQLLEESIAKMLEKLTQLAKVDVDDKIETILPPPVKEAEESELLAEKKEEESKALPCVTFKDLKKAIDDLKDDIIKDLHKRMGCINAVVEKVQNIVKDAAKSINVALNLDTRMTSLHSLIEECYLSGFGFELETQMKNFEDEIEEFHQTITTGIDQLNNVKNNAEMAAIMAMTDDCDDMMIQIETIQLEHESLEATNVQLNADLYSLLDFIKIFEEEKAEHEEVLNGLTSKVESSQLTGIVRGKDFAATRTDFKNRITQCYERFQRSVSLWEAVIEGLKKRNKKKLDFYELLLERDAVQHQLQDLNHKIRVLTGIVGDPEIAMKTRKLAEDATCGVCGEPAHMKPIDVTFGLPPRLPPLQPPVSVPQTMEPWISKWMRPGPSENRHICHRWCGGSHTLIDPKRLQLRVQIQEIPTEKFTEYAVDDLVYNMFGDKILPCIKCNNILDSKKTRDEKLVRDVTNIAEETNDLETTMKCACSLIK